MKKSLLIYLTALHLAGLQCSLLSSSLFTPLFNKVIPENKILTMLDKVSIVNESIPETVMKAIKRSLSVKKETPNVILYGRLNTENKKETIAICSKKENVSVALSSESTSRRDRKTYRTEPCYSFTLAKEDLNLDDIKQYLTVRRRKKVLTGVGASIAALSSLAYAAYYYLLKK